MNYLSKKLVPGLFDKYLDTYMYNKEIAEALLVHGVHPDYYKPYYEVPMLALSESRNEVDAFLLLLDYGARHEEYFKFRKKLDQKILF